MSNNEHTEQHHEFTQEAVRTQKVLTAISRCLDVTKIAHTGDRASAVYAIRAALEGKGTTWKLTDKGWVVPLDKSGNSISLQGAVEDCLLDSTLHIGDPESIQKVVASGGLEIKAKSDLSTRAQKAEAISRYGLDWWQNLPLHRTGVDNLNLDPNAMTRAEYNSMSMQQRIAFQKTITEQQLGQILHRR